MYTHVANINIMLINSNSMILFFTGFRTDRMCVKTTTVKGITIKEGSDILIPIHLIHRDPQYWEEPDKFDPDRYVPLHISFALSTIIFM